MKTDLIVTLRNTKIIKEQLSYLKMMHINNFRVNLARSDLEKNANLIDLINNYFENPKIFLDLPGEKIRLDKNNKLKSYYNVGDKILLSFDINKGLLLKKTYMYLDFKLNDVLVFGDNDLKVEIVSINSDIIETRVIAGGKLKKGTGIVNFTNYCPYNVISQYEINCLDLFDNYNITWNISFADTKKRVELCKNYIKKGNICAKIESPIGVKNLEEISSLVNGLMLARGDLSIFYDMNKINSDIFDILLSTAKRKELYLIVATNYFKGLAENKRISHDEKELLYEISKQDVNYILTNETSYCDLWKEIVLEYTEIFK